MTFGVGGRSFLQKKADFPSLADKQSPRYEKVK